MPSRFCGETALFGIRVAFESNHAEALSAALARFRQWNCAESLSPASVYIALVADEEKGTAADCTRIEGRRLDIVDDGVRLCADGEEGRGMCTFPAAAAKSQALTEAINTIVLFLVAQAGRIPVHASAIVVDGRALVLAGRSGSGKSALAMAADQAGLPVLSDDSVFVQLEPSFCLWGLPEAIHLSEKDGPPGIEGATRIRGGRVKRAYPTTNCRTRADSGVLCVLAPRDRVTLEPLDREAAVRTLTQQPEPGYDFYGRRMEDAVRAIAAGGCWRLSLSKDPKAAIRALVEAFSSPDSVCREARGHRG
jgi:hypothetical protein